MIIGRGITAVKVCNGNCYINVNEIFEDAQGNLSKEYSTDGAHILGKYYADWIQWILGRK